MCGRIPSAQSMDLRGRRLSDGVGISSWAPRLSLDGRKSPRKNGGELGVAPSYETESYPRIILDRIFAHNMSMFLFNLMFLFFAPYIHGIFKDLNPTNLNWLVV